VTNARVVSGDRRDLHNASIRRGRERECVLQNVGRSLPLRPGRLPRGELRFARQVIPTRTVLQGNLDPLALVAGGTALRREADIILDAARGRSFVFNLGHGIVPQTPVEHVASLVEQVRAA
jgi:uroporphyrinogen-III decarboxylase